jgi:hypothetical protein
MNPRCLLFLGCFFLACVAALTGCGQPPLPDQGAETLVVPVSHPVSRQVTDFVDYTGRTAALNSVDIRPRPEMSKTRRADDLAQGVDAPSIA